MEHPKPTLEHPNGEWRLQDNHGEEQERSTGQYVVGERDTKLIDDLDLMTKMDDERIDCDTPCGCDSMPDCHTLCGHECCSTEPSLDIDVPPVPTLPADSTPRVPRRREKVKAGAKRTLKDSVSARPIAPTRPIMRI